MNLMIIGLGFAGKRFLSVLNYLKNCEGFPIQNIALVDNNTSKFSEFRKEYQVFDDYDTALDTFNPDSVIVTLNEKDHYDFLKRLKKTDVSTILSEKPLVETFEQATELSYLKHRNFSMNLPERFSPVVSEFHKWRRNNPEFTNRRVEFFWGKDRLKDTRPTIGVMSEIIHPIDLVKYTFKTGEMEINNVLMTASDFSVSGRDKIDTCDLTMRSDNCTILGHSSFIWAKRHREMTGFLGNGEELVRANFVFDMPRWDCDQLQLDLIDRYGNTKEILSYNTTNADFPIELDQINKVASFVKQSLFPNVIADAKKVDLVDYKEACSLQRLLDNFQSTANRPSTQWTPLANSFEHRKAPLVSLFNNEKGLCL